MRQYTTPEQTAKLIELGLKKPKSIEKMIPQPVVDGYVHLVPQKAYSTGELIEILPMAMDCEIGDLGLNIENNIYETPNEWMVSYDSRHLTNSIELIDALYNMIVELKEEGVI